MCFTVKKVVRAKLLYILPQKPPTTLMFNLFFAVSKKNTFKIFDSFSYYFFKS